VDRAVKIVDRRTKNVDRRTKIVDRRTKIVDRRTKIADRTNKMHDGRTEVTVPARSHLFYFLKNFIKVKPFHIVNDSKY